MARVNFTAIVESITGKLAGSVFQDSYQGYQIRTRVSPRNPTSFYQQLRRGQFAFITRSFRNLTSTELASWQANAPPGESAINFYTSCNINLTLIGQSPITLFSPGTMPASMNVVITELTGSSFKVQAQGGITTVPAGHKLLLQATAVRGSTQIFTNPSMYTPVISFNEGTDLSIITDIFPDWISRYGVMKDEGRICLKTNLILKSNGLRGIDVVSCSNIEEMQKFFKVFNSSNQVTNPGTGVFYPYTYTLPAGTLNTDGSSIAFLFFGFCNSGTALFDVGVEFAGQLSDAGAVTGALTWYMTGKLSRNDANNATIALTVNYSDGSCLNANQSLSGLDFSTDQDLKLMFQCNEVNQLQSFFGDINVELF